MAITNEKSTEVTNQDVSPRVNNQTQVDKGRVRYQKFTFTQSAAAGDAGSTMLLVRLPATGRVIPHLSKIYTIDAFGAARTLDVGFAAHNLRTDGTAVVADTDFFITALDVSSANASALFDESDTDAVKDGFFPDAEEPVDILATVNGGTIPAATKIRGVVAYVLD